MVAIIENQGAIDAPMKDSSNVHESASPTRNQVLFQVGSAQQRHHGHQEDTIMVESNPAGAAPINGSPEAEANTSAAIGRLQQDATVSDLMKNKVENYDLDTAVQDLRETISETADLYHRLKRIKYDYLVLTCELLSRVDLPSVMIETCRQSINEIVPTAEKIFEKKF